MRKDLSISHVRENQGRELDVETVCKTTGPLPDYRPQSGLRDNVWKIQFPYYVKALENLSKAMFKISQNIYLLCMTIV